MESTPIVADDLPAEDLRRIARMALDRGAHLLTAGELCIARRIATLAGPAANLYARLSARVPELFEWNRLELPGPTPPATALGELEELGLIDRLADARQRAAQLTIPRLKAICVARGLRRSGSKATLVDRVVADGHLEPGPWIRIRHRRLLRRLERWAFLSRRADRSTLVVERLGHVIWPDYPLTGGPGLHRDRRALLAWEALLTPELDSQSALRALASGAGRAPGRLDLTHRLTRGLAELARSLESSDPAAALELYEALERAGHPPDPVRHARALEHLGRQPEALAHLRRSLERHRGPERLAIHRAGRRLARALRAGWAPDPPLGRPKKRTLRLPPAPPSASRPRYQVGPHPLPVEAAVVAELESLGRRALHAENGLWTTLFALCFAEAYFLPVPGALPCRWLSGPLDLGRPEFWVRRRQAIDGILAQLADGHGPARVREADRRWRGVRLAGARWEIARSDLVEVAAGLGGAALCDVLQILLERGWRAARGLPDLAILPGPAVTLAHAVPARLGPGLQLAEVKGPGDTVRDAQTLWFHRLRSAGAPIALWEVRALAPDARTTRP